ncbi:hypothetical protein MTR_8g008720 [Medicago truncatula]|uniref:Uncharacterized protein n=1 Tax=Medicago truncatula TaxID=3880 RepID=G7LCH9_MEDTR|nr:hypothetical protein MTR_8g008720 [Medicago truncatula]
MVSFSGCGISRQCCNHPYIIDESLQPLLLKVAFLNVGIKASGKLQLLDSMLTELITNKLRALILFQKQTVTKIFNDKNNERFFFLMETSVCHPSIKLSSVDTTIIYDICYSFIHVQDSPSSSIIACWCWLLATALIYAGFQAVLHFCAGSREGVFMSQGILVIGILR